MSKGKEDAGNGIAAAQRLQAKLQKMIAAAEKEEEQEKEMSDTQVHIRRFGLEAAEKAKVAANELFKHKQYAAAVKKYSGSLDILDQMDEVCGRIEEYQNPAVKQRWDLRTTVLNNRAEALLRLKQWESAEGDAEGVLTIDPWNEKALSRRRRARAGKAGTAGAEGEDGIDSVKGAAGVKESTPMGKLDPSPDREGSGRDSKEVDETYKGPTFWEVCLEQWPRTFTVLGQLGSYLRQHRGKLFVFYAILTFSLGRFVWTKGISGLFRPVQRLQR
jgi:tetratricopeptide (TPR) repeat protein